MEKMLEAWQATTLSGILAWIVITSIFNVTQKIRSFIQPWVTYHVQTGIPTILQIQKLQHKSLDVLFSVMSCVVSVPFYTGFLPLLFWSGHGRLARQMTLLMAFCDYIGNCIKDMISAPRPSCPPVRRLTATKDEEDNAQEYVTTFWAVLSFLLFFAYPTPELPTPSFEFHTAFNGVAFGIVAGIQQTFHQFHHEDVPRYFTPSLTTPAFVGRVLVGIPTILLVKYCSKALAKWILPVTLNTIGIPIRSTTYLPALNGTTAKTSDKTKHQSGYLQKIFLSSHEDSFDIDSGIRFIQYAGLAWSVVDLVPSLFFQLNL